MSAVGNLEEETSSKKGSSQKEQQQQDRRIDIQPAEDEEGMGFCFEIISTVKVVSNFSILLNVVTLVDRVVASTAVELKFSGSSSVIA